MFRRRHTPPTAAHGRAARWFWRLMLIGPALALLAGYIALRDAWFFPHKLIPMPWRTGDWAYSSPLAFQISYGLLLVLTCFAIAGVNATCLWFAWAARFFALWWSGPFFFIISEDIVSKGFCCGFHSTPPVPTLCQVKADLRLPFPDMWPLAMPWPLG